MIVFSEALLLCVCIASTCAADSAGDESLVPEEAPPEPQPSMSMDSESDRIESQSPIEAYIKEHPNTRVVPNDLKGQPYAQPSASYPMPPPFFWPVPAMQPMMAPPMMPSGVAYPPFFGYRSAPTAAPKPFGVWRMGGKADVGLPDDVRKHFREAEREDEKLARMVQMAEQRKAEKELGAGGMDPALAARLESGEARLDVANARVESPSMEEFPEIPEVVVREQKKPIMRKTAATGVKRTSGRPKKPKFLLRARLNKLPKSKRKKPTAIPELCAEAIVEVDDCRDKKLEKRWSFNAEDNRCYLYEDQCASVKSNTFLTIADCMNTCHP